MLHWINWIVLLSLEPFAGELKYVSVVWSAAGAWAGRYLMTRPYSVYEGVVRQVTLRAEALYYRFEVTEYHKVSRLRWSTVHRA